MVKRPIPKHILCRRITPKDDRMMTLCTPWSTPSVVVVRNSNRHAQNHLRMLMVSKSEVEMLNF